MSTFIPLAVTLAPELARWLSGDASAETAQAVEQAVKAATSAADPETAAAVLQRNPVMATNLRLQLARIAADQDEATTQVNMHQLADEIRAPTVASAALAWSAPIVSAAVLLTFGVVMVMILVFGMRPGSETTSNMLLGTLAAMATSVVSYWVGSSAGSARKDDRLAQLTK